MITHPWHNLSHGKYVPETVDAIIEVTRDSKAKYELDKETGFLRLDRILNTDLRYPFHYGFIPQTYSEDNDPLDIIVLCSEPLLPLSIVESTVIGAIHMIDNGLSDDKIIGVATHDPYLRHIKKLSDIAEEKLLSFKFFFENYKRHENKKVTIEYFLQKEDAHKLILESINLYKKNFKT